MSTICGVCGEIIFVSNRPDWKTNKQRPEMTCEKCNPRPSFPVNTFVCRCCGK